MLVWIFKGVFLIKKYVCDCVLKGSRMSVHLQLRCLLAFSPSPAGRKTAKYLHLCYDGYINKDDFDPLIHFPHRLSFLCPVFLDESMFISHKSIIKILYFRTNIFFSYLSFIFCEMQLMPDQWGKKKNFYLNFQTCTNSFRVRNHLR